MAYYLVNRLDTPAYIPDNYIHAFLLRDPHKSVYSLYKMSLNKDLTGQSGSNSARAIFRRFLYRTLMYNRLSTTATLTFEDNDVK